MYNKRIGLGIAPPDETTYDSTAKIEATEAEMDEYMQTQMDPAKVQAIAGRYRNQPLDSDDPDFLMQIYMDENMTWAQVHALVEKIMVEDVGYETGPLSSLISNIRKFLYNTIQ